MSEKKPIMVVIRASEMAESPVPSVEMNCGRCGQPVWVSKGNAAMALAFELVCPPCVQAQATTCPN
jgi:hypothetical protein